MSTILKHTQNNPNTILKQNIIANVSYYLPGAPQLLYLPRLTSPAAPQVSGGVSREGRLLEVHPGSLTPDYTALKSSGRKLLRC